MRVLIAGAAGQLGRELVATAPPTYELCAVDRDELDITDARAVRASRSAKDADVIVNAAAYTAVDRAEKEPELAYAVNAEGAANLAAVAAETGARMIHVSTDFVFDGRQATPYLPADRANPLSVYGASKLAGERHVRELTGDRAVVVRTSWLYSGHGTNFVTTMLRLMACRDEVGVVADQIGTPTWARTLAAALWAVAARPGLSGRLHWTDAGTASRYDFAVAVQEEALQLELLHRRVPIRPLRTQDFPTAAQRPAYSVLDKTETWSVLGIAADHWRVALRKMLQRVQALQRLQSA